MTDRWPLDRPVDEVRAQVRRRARERLVRRLSAGMVVTMLVVSGLTLVARDPGGTEVRTAGSPRRSTTTTTGGASISAGAGVETAASSSTTSVPAGGAGTGRMTVAPDREPDVGIGRDTITLGHVSTRATAGVVGSDSALLGTQAVLAYQNSEGGLWGRRLVLDARDDHALAVRNEAETKALLSTSFALLGSQSRYDDGMARALDGSEVADLGMPATDARRRARNNVSVRPSAPNQAVTTLFEWAATTNADAVKAVGTIHQKGTVLETVHAAHLAAARAAGWKIVYDRAVEPSDASATYDVVQMQRAGVRVVYLVGVDRAGAMRLAGSMRQQNFRPELFILDGAARLPDEEGAVLTSPTLLLDGQDDAAHDEVRRFREWFGRVAPGRLPDEDAATAWASGRLLFSAMETAGPLASRAEVLRLLGRIDHFDSGGLIADAGPGTERISSCLLLERVNGGRPTRLEPKRGFRCGGRVVQA